MLSRQRFYQCSLPGVVRSDDDIDPRCEDGLPESEKLM